MEACLPIAQDALRLALLPTINQMSIIGLGLYSWHDVGFPSSARIGSWCDSTRTGAILGGESVEQAARLQMVSLLKYEDLTQSFADHHVFNNS